MGRSTGVCGGKGGSQHLCNDGFYSNGIQGGIVPCAGGVALAEKVSRSGKIVVVFLGDGTFGEGVVYETMNIASLWKLPVLFVVENNRYAQTTPISRAFAGSFAARFQSFGIEVSEAETSDVLEILDFGTKAVGYVRNTFSPAALVIHTYRFCAHSKGDDMRDTAEVEAARKFDPLKIHGQRLKSEEREMIHMECIFEIDNAFRLAERDSFPNNQGVALEHLI
jgi:TPP-dependent pyruvate/acetoin dehydrogenase alpha subunit